AHRQPLAVADAWHRRRHCGGHRRLVHPTGHRRVGYQPVAEQTPVFGEDTQAPRLVAQTNGHRRRHRIRLVRELIARSLQLPRGTSWTSTTSCEPPTRCVNSPMNRCPTTRSTGSSTTHASPPAGETGKEPPPPWCVIPNRGSASPNSAPPAPADTSPS